MPVLEGLVDEIIFRNEENGYTVLSLKPDKGREFTCVGILPFINVGENVQIEGEWVEHRDYGKQLKAERAQVITPTTKSGIERYLASGIIRGVGPATAKLLIKKFGVDTLDVIEMNPDRLMEIEGIGPKKAQMIAESYAEQRANRVIMVFLTGLGLTPAYAHRIFTRYGENTEEVVRRDPYRLVDDINGIGFHTADEIAVSLGFQKFDERRLRSGIKFVLTDAMNISGHTYLPLEMLVNESARILRVDKDSVSRSLSQLIMRGEIVTEGESGNERLFLRSLYEAEADVAFRLIKLLKTSEKRDRTEGIRDAIANVENEKQMSFSDRQREAVTISASSGVCIITGGPGTGKTTLIQCLIELFSSEGPIELCAPTGRAAKRMTEATGREAKTVHRLLEYSGQEEMFKRNSDAPLDCKTVIVDEMSMVDVFLMRSLVKALKNGTRLILSGDADQLPSVGAGNVLGDLIESGMIPVVKLTEIFRQAEESAIVLNAHRINRGEFPVVNEKGTDFFLERLLSAQAAAKSAVNLVKTRLPKFAGLDPVRDIQVMTPMKKGDAGVFAMNALLQESLNPKGIKAEIRRGESIFRLGDKVMQIKNDYDIEWTKNGETGEGAFNGDIGFITMVDEEDKTVTVTFEDGRKITYTDDLLEEIELSYCMSVHKSQGSEFEAVVLILVSGPDMLLTRNLLYTAVTRAKRLVVITGREDCVQKMVLNNHINKRFSALSGRLREIGGGNSNDI